MISASSTRGASARVRPAYPVVNLAAAAALLLAVAGTRAWSFGDPVGDFDEQLYSLIGWRMTHGALPYVDVWDRKPFGLFALFALAHWIMGAGPIAYQLLASVFAFMGALLVYALSRDLVDRLTATLAGVLYLLILALYGGSSGQSEVFHTPLTLAMLWLVRDGSHPNAFRRAVIAMVVGGLALQVKYTVLPQCLFLGAYAIYGRWRAGASTRQLVRLAMLFAMAGILPTAAVALFYASVGHFPEFWFANFVSFFERLPGPSGRLRADLIPSLWPLLAILAMSLLAAFRLNPPRDWRIYGLFAGFALATLGSVLLPATVYLYYYGGMAGPLALLAVPFLDVRAPLKFVPAALVLCGLSYLYNPYGRYQVAVRDIRAEARFSADLARYVDGKANCLFVYDGPSALYRTTGGCLPSRYVYPDHFNNALETPALGIDQAGEIARILAHRPGVIVTADTSVTPQQPINTRLVGDAVSRDYSPIAAMPLHGRVITGWARKDLVIPR